MILRDELKNLQNTNTYPSLSIIMPTHRTFPDNKQDSIRLNNLVNNSKQRLMEEFNKRELKGLLENLDKLINSIDFNYLLDGMALYVNSNESHKLLFPFKVEERTLIDKNFATKDVVFMLNRAQPYWLLLINEKETRLFYCIREDFNEIFGSGFPVSNTLRENIGSELDMNEKIKLNPEKMKIYLREVDTELKRNNLDENEIIIAAVERYSSFFNEVTSKQNLIAGFIRGSYINADKALIHQAWGIVKELRRLNRKIILENIGHYIKNNMYASGINEVWGTAISGRIDRLLVEINYKYPAKISDQGLNLVPSELTSDPEMLDDAVDELIETTIKKGGKVTFYKDNELSRFNKIAATLRY